MAFTESLVVRFSNGAEISASLNFLDSGQVDLAVSGPQPRDAISASWSIDLTTSSLGFSITSQIGTHAACIATCLGISVGKALLECLLRSGSLSDIETCLKGKAIGAIADAIECIARCLGLIP